VVFDHGEGVCLYDVEGKKYLDFGAGIAVFALGYGDPEYNDALKEQIDRIIHTSNLYYHQPLMEAVEKVISHSGMSKVFFTNSGAEAIEGAIKAARKYAFLKGNADGAEIIAMNDSFHGRTVGALSVTGNSHYQDPFKPLMGGVKFAEFNQIESVKAQVNDRTCAILLETVQGEGGIHPADPAFLTELRELCDERDILLILDEIQCGMGRTGSWFACQGYGVNPDIMTTAKALGCGMPVGAFLLNEKAAEKSLAPGDHGTTYGGNPLACAAIDKVLDLFETNHIIDNVREVSGYLEERLDDLKEHHSDIIDRRGSGLLQGLEFDHPVGDIIKNALDKGLILINAGTNIIRFIPPLVITRDDVDSMIAILETCL
jgi:acetylornithine/N-succinyldiaminopimelate aminotransferase